MLRKSKFISIIIIFIIIVAIVLGIFFYKQIKRDKGKGLIGSNLSLSFPAQVIKSDYTRFFINTETTNIGAIKARLKYKAGPREIKLGIKGGEKQKYIYQTFYQKLLQECNWEKIIEGQDILYQRTPQYSFLSELLDNLPPKDKIAVYESQWPQLIRMSLSDELRQKDAGNIKQTVSLKGSYTFVLGVDKSPLIFKLAKQDINARAGEDKYLISLKKNGRLIDEKAIFDDGFTGKEKLKKEPQSIEFNLEDISPGVYEVLAEFEGEGSDALITLVETNQPKMVIKNNGSFYDKTPVTLYTNHPSVVFKVSSKEYLQTIQLNDDIPLAIEKEGEKYTFDLSKLDPEANLYKLEIPNPFITLTSTGYFSFSPEQYFNPDLIYGLGLNTLDSLEQIDYILTSVPKASQEGDWFISEITFEAEDIRIDEDKKIYFSLETPGLQKDKGELIIDSFEIEAKIPGFLAEGFLGKEDKATPVLTPTVTPIPTLNKNVKIKVLNNGAPVGYAQKYADLLMSAGYINVEFGNTEEKETKETSIIHPKTSEIDALKIEQILKNKYKIVNKVINNESSEIIVNIGSLLVNATPTITP